MLEAVDTRALDPLGLCERRQRADLSAVDPFEEKNVKNILYTIDDDDNSAKKAPAWYTVGDKRPPASPALFGQSQREEYAVDPNRQSLAGTTGYQADEPDVEVGERVSVFDGKSKGKVRFVGKTRFSTGIFVGVELDEPCGMNDGSVRGQKYFSCEPNHGVFVRPTAIEHIYA